MSLFKKIRKGFKKVFKPAAQVAVGSIPGIGPTLSSVVFNGGAKMPPPVSGFVGGAIGAGSMLPRVIPGIGAAAGRVAVGTAVGAGVRALSPTTIARSAVAWCRRNPAWCASIGGTAAVEALVRSGELPPVKRRRARGITANELKAFRRVASIVRQHAPTARKVPCKPRGKVCR